MSAPTFRDPRTDTAYPVARGNAILVTERFRLSVRRDGDLYFRAVVYTDAATVTIRVPGDINDESTVQRALDALSRALAEPKPAEADFAWTEAEALAAENKRLRDIVDAALTWGRAERDMLTDHSDCALRFAFSKLAELRLRVRAALTKEAPDA